MDFKLIWNDLCHGIKKVEKEEKSARIFIEGVFGRLGWSLSENEIVRKEKAEEGETPDIIVAKNNESLFAVELKKTGVDMDEHVKQLLGYMRSLKLNIGVSLGDSLRVYHKSPGDDGRYRETNEIPLQENTQGGVELLSLLSKDVFSFNILTKYLEANMKPINITPKAANPTETIPDRLKAIRAHLRDEKKERGGIRFEMGNVRKDSLLGYNRRGKGFEINIKPSGSKIKLWDNNQSWDWYENELANIMKQLSGFKIEGICRAKKKDKTKCGFYIPLDNFHEPRDNPPTRENILNILVAVNKVMNYET